MEAQAALDAAAKREQDATEAARARLDASRVDPGCARKRARLEADAKLAVAEQTWSFWERRARQALAERTAMGDSSDDDGLP